MSCVSSNKDLKYKGVEWVNFLFINFAFNIRLTDVVDKNILLSEQFMDAAILNI